MGFFEDLLFCLPDLFLYAYFFLIKETRLKLISGVTVLPLMQLPRVIGDTVASSVSRKAVAHKHQLSSTMTVLLSPGQEAGSPAHSSSAC